MCISTFSCFGPSFVTLVPPQDESRLLKRKEQNRAAQRAFRERKEKHVKDVSLISSVVPPRLRLGA